MKNHHAWVYFRGAPGEFDIGVIVSHSQWCLPSPAAINIVNIGMTINKMTHQLDIRSSWWVYCRVSNNQNAAINAISIYCSFAHTIFTVIIAEATSKPENSTQPPIDIIISVKKMIPGVFHHLALIILSVKEMVAASNAISTSDVNCQVNAMSSVYWRWDNNI